jgi:hypothetical protein
MDFDIGALILVMRVAWEVVYALLNAVEAREERLWVPG